MLTTLTPEIITLIAKKFPKTKDAVRLASTCKSMRALIWDAIKARPSQTLSNAALVFMKELQQHYASEYQLETTIIHTAQNTVAYTTTGKHAEIVSNFTHRARLVDKDNHKMETLELSFKLGRNYFTLTIHPTADADLTCTVYPETGYLQYGTESTEYTPPHLLARFHQMGYLK
jgi:hypothetical protein